MDKNEEVPPEEVALNIHLPDSKTKKEENPVDELLPDGFDKTFEHKISLKEIVPQIIISCMIHCTVIQAGVNMAYSTILEDGLNKDFLTTKNEISWIASLVTLSLPIGSFIVGPLMDNYGRKKICMASCIPSIISWILLALANSLSLIYIARMIAGFSGGLSTVGLVYISEITHPQIRPMLLCFNSIFVSLGILITYCLGVWLTWDQIAIVFLVMNVCIFFFLMLIPESPYWLMCFGKAELTERKKQVEIVLRRLNKSDQSFEQEFQRINEISLSHRNTDDSSFSKKCLYLYEQLKYPSVYKPGIMLLIIFLLQQLAGTYVIIFYALSVFENIGGNFGKGLDKYGAMVILGVIRFLMSVLTALFSKKFGRRILCITSGLGMAFSMFFSAMYIYLTSSCDENGHIKEVMANQQWVLLVIVLFYVCTSSLGFTIIPWTLIGELFPISVKGIMGGIMVAIAYIMMFGVIKSYPFMMDYMGAQGVFFFFSITSLIAASFVYIFLPETLGKSFSEIENYFNNKKKSEVHILMKTLDSTDN